MVRWNPLNWPNMRLSCCQAKHGSSNPWHKRAGGKREHRNDRRRTVIEITDAGQAIINDNAAKAAEMQHKFAINLAHGGLKRC